ncbi:MAG: protein kinase [Deltaproteobacteria bacterium]|nr:protein kinase [Deltaproteobacteria bacterium]
MQPQAESSLIGLALDNKFKILRLIGRGGMGEVFEAEHVGLGKRVAIKLMLEKYSGDGEAIARFTREAHAASRIGNPHIIDVSDIGTAPDGRAFVVMELLQGSPLGKVIEDGGPMPPQRALHVMRQVLRAVGAAHAKGIVHRDLKPDNIFLIDGGEQQDFVKLLDFGISKMMDPDLQAAATKLTTTGVVMGTPLYMAPEQAMGVDIDHLADIYACGVILYEMLAGRPPFEGATYAVLVAKLLTTEPQLLSELRPGLAPKLIAAVHRALEKEPNKRFASAEAFAAALPATNSASAIELAGTLASGKVVAVPRPAPPRSRAPWVAMALALAVGIATAAVVIVMNKENAADTKPRPEAAPVMAPTESPSVPATPVTADPRAVEANTGRLDVKSRPPGATVIVDGVTYKGQVTLTAGPHKIRLELDGYKPAETDYEITAGVPHMIEIGLERDTRPVTSKPAAATQIKSSQIKSTHKAPPGIKPTPAGVTVSTPEDPKKVKPVVEDNAPPPPPPPVIKQDGPKQQPNTTTLTPRSNPYTNP